jgi:hypothetical protein
MTWARPPARPALMQVKPRPARGAKLTIPDNGAE